MALRNIYCRVFEDVVDGLKALTKAEKQVFVFSTSSVETQKLLFGYSDKGDLQEVRLYLCT